MQVTSEKDLKGEYVFTQPLHSNVTRVQLVLNSVSLSPKLVAIPRLKSSIHPANYS